MIERYDIRDDPRFATNADRVANRDLLNDVLTPIFLQKPAEDWVDLFLAEGVPAGPINNFEQVFAAEHTMAREMMMKVDHPVEGQYNSLGFPVKLSGTPQQVRHAPPLLGQHTDEIARELGLDPDALRTEGAFG